MFEIILLFIIFMALIFIIIQRSENMTDHNFKYLNSKASLFVSNDLYTTDERIELTSLPNCDVDFTYDYGSNYNNIVNNEISVFQDIINPLEHTIEIDNINYNLISVRWKLSKFSYNNLNVGLDLHLIHQNYNTLSKIIIVVPLSLTNDGALETFKNIGYKKFINDIVSYADKNINENTINDIVSYADKNINENTINDIVSYADKNINENTIKNLIIPIKDKTKKFINSKKNTYNLQIKKLVKKIKNNFSLNKLIPSPVLVPEYECCGNKIGQSARFNLCDIQNLLQENKKYYQLEDKEANKYFITEPIEFNEEVGLNIMNNIVYDNSILYLKK